jgi:hypothetical protein
LADLPSKEFKQVCKLEGGEEQDEGKNKNKSSCSKTIDDKTTTILIVHSCYQGLPFSKVLLQGML